MNKPAGAARSTLHIDAHLHHGDVAGAHDESAVEVAAAHQAATDRHRRQFAVARDRSGEGGRSRAAPHVEAYLHRAEARAEGEDFSAVSADAADERAADGDGFDR